MENGRITIEGPPARLHDDPHVLASYLGGQANKADSYLRHHNTPWMIVGT